MEIELKYKIADISDADRIWNDPELLSVCGLQSRETLQIEAVYFDTSDHALEKNKMAFRLRKEGDRYTASIKGNGVSCDGLHQRTEYNAGIAEDVYYLKKPHPDIFKGAQIWKDLSDIVSGKELTPVLTMRFIRKKMILCEGECVCELAIDTGEISAGRRSENICELEIELIQGTAELMKKLGRRLCGKYGIFPEDRSKYERGLALLQEVPVSSQK